MKVRPRHIAATLVDQFYEIYFNKLNLVVRM